MKRLPTVANIAKWFSPVERAMGPFAWMIDALALGLFVLLLTVGLPHYARSRDNAREMEVKSNLRTIQVALERYSVDRGGLYPVMLYGGHFGDTFASSRAAVASEFPGDVDWLLELSYFSEYPQNPFRRGSNTQLIVDARPYFNDGTDILCDPQGVPYARTNLWRTQGTRGSADRSQQWIPRQVGGPLGDRMWDVSEGQRHPPFLIHVFPHDGLGPNPCPQLKCDRVRFHDDFNCWLNVGNFYYYPTFSGIGNLGSYESDTKTVSFDRPVLGICTGYKLSAFGAQSNPGRDVLQRFGEFPEYSFNMRTDLSDNMDNIYTGPDGRRDGVIEVVQEDDHWRKSRMRKGGGASP